MLVRQRFRHAGWVSKTDLLLLSTEFFPFLRNQFAVLADVHAFVIAGCEPLQTVVDKRIPRLLDKPVVFD